MKHEPLPKYKQPFQRVLCDLAVNAVSAEDYDVIGDIAAGGLYMSGSATVSMWLEDVIAEADELARRGNHG